MNRHSLTNFLMLFLLIAYYSQGVLYPSEGIISQVFLILFLAISFVYFIKVVFLWNIKLSSFIYVWTFLLIINIIGFVLNVSSDGLSQFKAILLNMLPFYAFYFFTVKNILLRHHLIFVLVVL